MKGVIHHSQLQLASPDESLFQEWNTYCREVNKLLSEGLEGKFVLIKETAIIGVFDSEDDALEEGNRRFLRNPFLIQQIREFEPLLRIRGFNMPCQRLVIPSAKSA